jgi:citrate synthase
MSTIDISDVQSGLEGVVAFATTIAEPDKEGGALRYRGVDIEDLVGKVPYEKVWGLLVDGSFDPGLAPAQPHPLLVRSGDHRVDVQAALAELKARKPDRVLATNVEFWSAVILDLAAVPADLFTPMFTCARVAGWSAHILEQKREGRLIRPTAKYIGEGPRPVSAVA